MFKEIVKKLGLKPADYSQWSTKSESFLMHQLRRQIRYRCFAMQREIVEDVTPTIDISKKFIKHFEAQPDFSGWELFADRWDINKTDPSTTYPRLLSIADEWEAKLKMCVPELPGAISYKQSR